MSVWSTYFEALGTFIQQFAMAENKLQRALNALSGVSPEIAVVLFSTVRTSDGIDLIHKLHRARGLDDDLELERALKQFGAIAKTRNDILHFGSQFGADPLKSKFVVSNAERVGDDNARVMLIDIPTLEALELDIGDIKRFLVFRSTFWAHPTMGRDRAWQLPEPWRYIPQAPPPQNRQQRNKPQAPPRPPQS